MNDIDILEELIRLLRFKPKDNPKAKLELDYLSQEKFAKAISNLISENKELKEIVETLRKENVEAMIQRRQYELHYIPISVIEKKIEELEDIKIKTQRLYPHTYTAIGEWLEAHYKINILQEILDERNNTDEH